MQWVDTVRQIRNPLFLRYKALPSPLSPPPPSPPLLLFFGLVLPLSSATSRQYFLRTNQPAQVKSTCSIFKDPDESLGNRTFEYWHCVLLSFFPFFFFFFLIHSTPFVPTGHYQLWLDDYRMGRKEGRKEGREREREKEEEIKDLKRVTFSHFQARYD